MFPHDKLDWTLARLERSLDDSPDDVPTRTRYALAALSRAWFHEGDESWANTALTQARRVLHHDPGSATAMVVAGISLALMDRLEPSARYLDQAVRVEPEAALVHLGLGELHLRQGDRHQAVRELEFACRQAPDAWEAHALLGQLLRQRAGALGHPPRILERSQYHLIAALQRTPSLTWKPRLILELSLACLQTGRFADAHKLLSRLVDHPKYRDPARYHMGMVAMHMGKYKNAVLHLRQHAQGRGDHPQVYSRIATCYLHLGELRKAREACNHTLALEPGHVEARFTLACTLLEEDRVDEAVRLFKEILQDAPDHLPAFREVVRIRRASRDTDWLVRALRAEISAYDRLPHTIEDERGATVHPREATRARIDLIIEGLSEVGETPEQDLLDAMVLTTDEALRARLWEAALDVLMADRARDAVRWLREPGRWFSAERGHELVALASALPEDALRSGLQLTEADLQRAAVDRHGPAGDVITHRRHVESERQEARAWQALALVALGEQGSDSARNLLLRWASEADPELASAARAGLSLAGDPHALAALHSQAQGPGAQATLDRLERALQPTHQRAGYRPVSDSDVHTCATCGRRAPEVDHLMVRGEPGQGTAVCDRCLASVARRRHELSTDDPRVTCALTGRSIVDSRAIYVLNGVPIAEEVVEHSLGLAEREEVDRFLADW